MKDFKKLIVWQKSMDLFVDIHKMSKKMPIEERYEIAEGSAKVTNPHYKQFLENSLGSAYETETALIAITKLYGALKEEIDGLLERITEIQRMLIAFINKLK